MIIATAKGTVNAKDKADFLSRMKKLSPLVKAEEGCITYEVYESSFEPNVLFFFEVWESQAHLDAHFGQPHMQKHHKEVEGMFPNGYDFKTYQAG